MSFLIGPAKGNPTAAARLANYRAPKKAAHRLMQRSDVRAAIGRKLAELEVDERQVMIELVEIGFGDVSMCYKADPKSGQPVLDYELMKKYNKLHLIEQVIPTKYGMSIKLHSKLHALGMVAKVRGLVTERTETNVSIDVADVRASLQAKMARLVEVAREDERRQGHGLALPAPEADGAVG